MNNIESFFKDIKYILSDKKENTSKQRTNIIYLNTDCNLRCTYCYESSSRKGLPDQIDCTPAMIDEFLAEICTREKNVISTIVIMGGEPFLRFDLIQYTIARAFQLSGPNKHKGFGISLITNATLFNNKKLNSLKSLIEKVKKNNVNVNIEISYDCSGQFKRKFPDGSNSKTLVEKSINSLIEKKIPFKIIYTVHSSNYNNVVKDIIYILEKWKSEYLFRITIGYAYQELDDVLKIQNAGKNIKTKIIPYMESIFKKYRKPICGHVCHLCKICNHNNFIGNSYLSPTTGITYDKKQTEHKFKQF